MSLPTIEPLPDESENLPPARRRRQRRMIVPQDSSEHAEFLQELAHRTVPSFDFFLFSLLCGLMLAGALLLDSPALVVLAALIAPFMAPVIGMSLGTITGAVRFVLQSLGSLSVGSLIVFLCGAVAGWAVNLLPQRVYQQAAYHSQFTWAGFFVLLVGAGVTTYLTVRSPNQKPLVASVAIAYSLYLPVGVAGFGLTSGIDALWPNGLGLFFLHLLWAVLVGTVVLGLLGLRPLNVTGYVLGAAYALTGLAAAAWVAFTVAPLPNLPRTSGGAAPVSVAGASALEASTVTPTPTDTSTPTPVTPSPSPTRTRTLVPTRTATVTITPVATPVWARISAIGGDGAMVREKPDYDAKVVQSLLNGTLVEVLPDVVNVGGVAWVHIRTVNDKEGWIVRTLLRTATPAPNW